jgi:hypothetical protein
MTRGFDTGTSRKGGCDDGAERAIGIRSLDKEHRPAEGRMVPDRKETK